MNEILIIILLMCLGALSFLIMRLFSNKANERVDAMRTLIQNELKNNCMEFAAGLRAKS